MSCDLSYVHAISLTFGGRSDEQFSSVVSSAAAAMTATATTSAGASTPTGAAAGLHDGSVQAALLGIGAVVLAAF